MQKITLDIFRHGGYELVALRKNITADDILAFLSERISELTNEHTNALTNFAWGKPASWETVANAINNEGKVLTLLLNTLPKFLKKD